ncbi:site-specific integrase [Microbacterium hatanonis]|uniref:Site-specific integrase n=1 Tax=Microbacterium hatanonis TaxID=404366 RepID=A0A5C8I0B3_9MICO|nr:site-specific integrase [Microbacterium hatanonis]TXK12347.1 site-specific integrase [Microbacterium hatanonis]
MPEPVEHAREAFGAQNPTPFVIPQRDDLQTVGEAVEFLNARDWIHKNSKQRARVGVSAILEWLALHPGDSWQARWESSGIENDVSWKSRIMTPYDQSRGSAWGPGTAAGGVGYLVALDMVRPSYEWLQSASGSLKNLPRVVVGHRDPVGGEQVVAALRDRADRPEKADRHVRDAMYVLACIMGRTGKTQLADVTVDDISLAISARKAVGAGPQTGSLYDAISILGLLPADAPPRFRDLRKLGQLSIEELVDRTGIKSRRVRNFFVDYFRARAHLRYSTILQLVSRLVQNFWVEIEMLSPGIDTMDLPADLVDRWRDRIKVVQYGTNKGKPRTDVGSITLGVRRLYFDINDWAFSDPERYGDLAARNPIPAHDTKMRARMHRARRANSHQRTRERLPHLPTLMAHVEDQKRLFKAVLEAVEPMEESGRVEVSGESFLRLGIDFLTSKGSRYEAGNPPIHVRRLSTGVIFDARAEESTAFWRWATLMAMKETGCRIEELEELTHSSLVQYRLPSTGELLPLLQLAPSKNDKERVLLMSEELTDVISAVISRVRGTASDGRVPLVVRYDWSEKTYSDPLPFLFQRSIEGENRVINRAWTLKHLNQVVEEVGILDESGNPVRFHNHDLRRIFATEATMQGLPIHIVAKILGHESLHTTTGYAAIYDEEVYRNYRAFIDRRRMQRPSVEYREPTEEEWEDFLGHFERRQLELGTCGRAYGADCVHEHACIRCTMFRPDPRAEARFVEIVDNLEARIAEALENNWLGEVEGLQVSLAGARDKLERVRRKPVSLGIPILREQP